MNQDGTSLATYENIGSKQTKGFEYNIVGSLGKKMRLIFGGNTYWDDVNTDLYGDVYDKHQEQIILELHLHTMFFLDELSFYVSPA